MVFIRTWSHQGQGKTTGCRGQSSFATNNFMEACLQNHLKKQPQVMFGKCLKDNLQCFSDDVPIKKKSQIFNTQHQFSFLI